LSTSTSKAIVGEPSAPHEDEELFDLLDSWVSADSKFYLLLAPFLLTYVKSLPFVSFAVTTRTRRRMLPLLLLLRLRLPMNLLCKKLLRWWSLQKLLLRGSPLLVVPNVWRSRQMSVFPSTPINQRALLALCVLILVFLLSFLRELPTHVFLWTDLDEEVPLFGHWMCRIFENY
jgi:hypothetical protein